MVLGDFLGRSRPKFACINFVGGLGNQMFHYAYGYSVSTKRNLQLIIPEDNMLIDIFNVKSNSFLDYGFDETTCGCLLRAENGLNCGYDDKLETLPDTDLSFIGYYQSWKYWISYENKLRKIFTFNKKISKSAERVLSGIIRHRNVTRDTTFVGVHIRNGDFTRKFGYYGFSVAPRSYIMDAIHYFRNRYKNILFIVATNELQWTLDNFGSFKDVTIVTNNTASVDMALLSMTNHTIMTTGTFGWMIAWLTRGTTLYYKYPYRPGSDFAKHFHPNTSDYFYPGWIGLG